MRWQRIVIGSGKSGHCENAAVKTNKQKTKYFIHISLLHAKKKDIYMAGYKSY